MLNTTSSNNVQDYSKVFKVIINHIRDIFVELDLNGNVIYLNPKVYDVLGYKSEEVIGLNIDKFIHPEDILNLVDKTKDLLIRGGQNVIDFRALHKNGHYVHLSANYTVIEENHTTKLIAVLYKISPQEEIEEINRFIAENINDTVAVLDDKLELMFINEMQKKSLGFSTEDILGKSPLELLHPDDINKAKRIFSRTLKKEHGRGQFRIRSKDNSYKWMDINGRLTFDKDGNQRILLVSRDITQEKEMELKIIEQNKDLEQLNLLKNEFLSRASHELKTPLASIKGNADLMKMIHHKNLKPDIIVMLEVIQRNCIRLENIINKIIESSKLETSKIELLTTKEDLSSLIKLCVNEVQTLAKIRNLKINLNMKDLLITKFNKDQIHEVISNLLTNAINYSPPDVVIDIFSKVNDNVISISFKDRGFGFTEDEKLKIFKKYGKINRREQGFDVLVESSGLGLYISKKIIELHGGKIWVESDGQNKGSIFSFTLPII